MVDEIASMGEAAVGIVQKFGGGAERLDAELADNRGEVVFGDRENCEEKPAGTTHNEERPSPSPCS